MLNPASTTWPSPPLPVATAVSFSRKFATPPISRSSSQTIVTVIIAGVAENGDADKYESLSHFLPHRFGPDDLLDKNVALALEPHHNHLSFLSDSNSNIPNGINSRVCDDLKYEALEAANKSHAPYSNCPSGVALMDCEGKVYRGSYMESAAYNPSLGPVQAALVAYLVGGSGDGYEKIVAAVLVEKEGAVVRQEYMARKVERLQLDHFSPWPSCANAQSDPIFFCPFFWAFEMMRRLDGGCDSGIVPYEVIFR
ncbi:hypothetical protein GH714_022898 [Hevea brasiliensis]|uniref:CMP/dCMP-type deaminase domain-containing protein n=1 Tax=Hevea brasiliensis TaxID=3981 RepID=A0A6A6NJS2_HEVBR|nr:hypothetical protein GH714_022898 [Hevea brasiliensis]